MEGWSCSRTNSYTQGALFSLANHLLDVNKYFYVVQEWDDNPVHMSFFKKLTAWETQWPIWRELIPNIGVTYGLDLYCRQNMNTTKPYIVK